MKWRAGGRCTGCPHVVIFIINGVPFEFCFATCLPVLTGKSVFSPARPQTAGTNLLMCPSISISGSPGCRGVIGGRR